jgi:hypothetical protein
MFSGGGASYAPVGRPLGPEGEGDNDPIGVVLTRTTVHPATLSVSDSLSAAQASAAKPQARSWWVQVGAFRSHQEAKAQVEDVSHRFAKTFDDAEGSVAGQGHSFSARFSGFTEDGANAACATVKPRGVPCAVGGGA